MKLTKIRKILKFKQSDWLKNTLILAQKNAGNSFEKNFFELKINCVYGKAMENIRKIINVRLVNNEKDYLEHINQHVSNQI